MPIAASGNVATAVIRCERRSGGECSTILRQIYDPCSRLEREWAACHGLTVHADMYDCFRGAELPRIC